MVINNCRLLWGEWREPSLFKRLHWIINKFWVWEWPIKWVKLGNLVGKWEIKCKTILTDWCEFITNNRVIHLKWVDWWVKKESLGNKFLIIEGVIWWANVEVI